jgi:hypothetical protein
MDKDNEALARELSGLIVGAGYKTAFEGTEDGATEDDPLEGDFFTAINAFRKARALGDPEAVARAEEHLRSVVRAELEDGRCL